ncbi:unnamed protein product [Polarella glacialis]|uniref:Uncharacterized protein n=1 Tax=Polarella glacialis TaxID=89957 RepID=A0A813L4Z5_POLGL|nr:unnamed protein product [Polarella glacialis]
MCSLCYENNETNNITPFHLAMAASGCLFQSVCLHIGKHCVTPRCVALAALCFVFRDSSCSITTNHSTMCGAGGFRCFCFLFRAGAYANHETPLVTSGWFLFVFDGAGEKHKMFGACGFGSCLGVHAIGCF